MRDTVAYIGNLAAYESVTISETATPSRELTENRSQIATQTPTPPATQTAVVTAQSTATSPQPDSVDLFVAQATLNTNANLRSGPGTEHEITEIGNAGNTYPVYARTLNGWLLLDTVGKTWVASSLANLDKEEIQIPIWDGKPITSSEDLINPNVTSGLGVSRDDFYRVFVEPDGLFEFEPAVTLSNGMPRVIGTTSDTKAIIELIGPPDDLYKVSLVTIMPTTSIDVLDISLVTAGFIKIAEPTWDGAVDWFTESYGKTTQTGENISIVHEGKVFELQAENTVGIVILSISVEGYGK